MVKLPVTPFGLTATDFGCEVVLSKLLSPAFEAVTAQDPAPLVITSWPASAPVPRAQASLVPVE